MKDCNSCGKCCIKYSDGGLSASKSEIELWDIFAPHISGYVKNGEIWFDPDSGQPIDLCPFLRRDEENKKYTCDIYFNRPDDCRFYPSTVQEMISDGCEMIEDRDLKDSKAAQKQLDRLMINSRSSTY